MFVFRPLIWIIFVLFALLAIAGIFLLTFDANRYKPDIVALVKQQTGRDLEVAGKIDLSVYPNIALKLGQVKLGNADGFKGKNFASASDARVSVQLMPLLEQKLRVDEVTLQGLNLTLQRDKSGKTNWDDLLPAGSEQQDDQVGQVVARLLGSFMVAGVSVKDSQIHWQDAQTGQNMTLAPINLTTGTLRPGKPVDISLATRLQDATTALDVSLDGSTTAKLADNGNDFSLSGLKLKVTAHNKPATGDTLDANLSADVNGNLQTKALAANGLVAAIDIASKAKGNLHADVKGTLRSETGAQQYFIPDLLANVQLPGLGTAQISGRMQADLARQAVSLGGMKVQTNINSPQAGQVNANISGNSHLDMASQTLKIDGMQLQAKLQGGKLPAQSADIKASGSTRLQLAQQELSIGGLKLNTNLQGGDIPGGSLQQQGTGELKLNWGSGKGVLDLFQTTLNLMGQQLAGRLQVRDPMAAMSMDGEFKANTLNYPPFQLQKATLGVQMANGIVTLKPQGTLFRGGYQGNIQINTGKTPAVLTMTHKTSGLRTEDLLYALTQDKTITGALDLTANLNSVAGDEVAFKRNLSGTVDIALKNGTIRDSNFAQKTKQVVKLFEKESVNNMGEKEVAFTTLGGHWTVQHGVFHTDENTLLAPYFQIKGNGDVNIANESLDVKLKVGQKPKPDKPEGIYAPLHIHGPWSNLSYALELDLLVKQLAQQRLDEEKAKLQEKLEAEKQKQLDALKQKADAEKARLQQKLQDEKDKLQQKLQNQAGKQLDGVGKALGGQTDQLQKKLEDQLKNKLKGLF